MNMLRMSEEEAAKLQARIQSQSTVRTVRHMQTEHEAAIGKNAAVAARKRNTKPANFIPESTVLHDCSRVLDQHPLVAFWWRNNVGATTLRGRYVKFSFVGASDLMAVSTRGRFMAVECKATGKKPTDEQAAFLSNVKKAGGFAVCVDHPGKLVLALRNL